MPASGTTLFPGDTTVRLAVTRSEGAFGSSTARAAASGGNERTRSRARSSTRASGRLTAPPSNGDAAGLAPRKHGVAETSGPCRSEEHTPGLPSRQYLGCRLLLAQQNSTPALPILVQ